VVEQVGRNREGWTTSGIARIEYLCRRKLLWNVHVLACQMSEMTVCRTRSCWEHRHRHWHVNPQKCNWGWWWSRRQSSEHAQTSDAWSHLLSQNSQTSDCFLFSRTPPDLIDRLGQSNHQSLCMAWWKGCKGVFGKAKPMAYCIETPFSTLSRRQPSLRVGRRLPRLPMAWPHEPVERSCIPPGLCDPS